MIYPYIVYLEKDGDDTYWVARSVELDGCIGAGISSEEAIKELEENEAAWIETAKEVGITIPKQPVMEGIKYSGKITLRFSPAEHMKAAMLAQIEGISLNQYISDAVANYNATLIK